MSCRSTTLLLCCAAALISGCSPATISGADWTVSNIGAPVNSPDHEAFPTITTDGLTLYFARGNAATSAGSGAREWRDVADWDIYVSTRADLQSPWRVPRRLPGHINTMGSEHSVSLSPDGHWLYFSSDALDTCGGMDIFRSYRSDTSDEIGWGVPENLGCDVNTAKHDVCVIYHQEDDSSLASLYFVSNREGTLGGMDSWRVDYDPATGEYTEAENLTAISSPEFEGHLDPEQGFVWSRREGGYGGSDLWRSGRDDNGNWLPPVNLGNAINTAYEEQLPSPFDDGRAIYFPSDRPGGEGGLDIYVAERLH